MEILGNTLINDGDMHHITVTYNNGQVLLYVDGDLDMNCELGAIAHENNSNSITIGSYRTYPSNYDFNGAIT